MTDPPGPDRDRKGRADANRIGESGEAAFVSWATDNGLLPTRPAHDYGLDFLMQVDTRPNTPGVSSMAGVWLGAAVRSSAARRPRFSLRRKDARALLDYFMGCMVVVVKISPNNQKQIRYRPIDVEFADELATFLDSDRDRVEVAWEACSGASALRDDVRSMCDPSFVTRRRIALAERRIGRSLPGASVEVRQLADQQRTYLTVPQFFGIFEQDDDEARRAVYAATFGAPRLQAARLRKLTLSRALTDQFDSLPSPIQLMAPTSGPLVQIVVSGTHRVGCGFRSVSNRGHNGYVHDAGFAITFGARRRDGDQWVHDVQCFVDEEADIDLEQHSDLSRFLEACADGEVLRFSTAPKTAFPISDISSLARLGHYAGALRVLREVDGWHASATRLHDAFDGESMTTVAWLSAAVGSPDFGGVSFMRSNVDRDALTGRRARWRVPIVANTTRASIVAWFDTEGEIAFDEQGEIVGMTAERVDGVELEVHARIAKETGFPEAVFQPELAVVALTPETAAQTRSAFGEEWCVQWQFLDA